MIRIRTNVSLAVEAATELLIDDGPILFSAIDDCSEDDRAVYLSGGGANSPTANVSRIIKFDTRTMQRGQELLAEPGAEFQALAVDCVSTYLYASQLVSNIHRVLKIDRRNLTIVESIDLPFPASVGSTITVAMLASPSPQPGQPRYSYWISQAGLVARVLLDPFVVDINITLEIADRINTGFLDEINGFIYLGCGTAPGRIVRIDVRDGRLSRVDEITLPLGDFVLSSVYNPFNFTGIFGAIALPPQLTGAGRPVIVEVQLSNVINVGTDDGDDSPAEIPVSVFVISIVGATAVISALALYVYKKRLYATEYRRLKPTATVPEGGLEVDSSVKIISFDQEIELGECIGVGSMGEVYRGTYHGTEVAVKKLHVSYQNLSAEAASDVADEMALHSNLRHPNIIAFLGGCVVPPNICFVMEYMPRHSLHNVLHAQPRTKLEWRLVVKMALDAARGMNYLHSSHPSIVHRDLKSHNLLVDVNYTVKVTDFGSARIKEHFAYTLSCIGTPQWMAPEVIRGEHYSEKCDVYSFGIVLWELFTQEDPYANMHPIQVATLVAYKDLRPDIPEDCPPTFRQLMLECWDSQTTKRPSFREIVQRISQIEFE